MFPADAGLKMPSLALLNCSHEQQRQSSVLLDHSHIAALLLEKIDPAILRMADLFTRAAPRIIGENHFLPDVLRADAFLVICGSRL